MGYLTFNKDAYSTHCKNYLAYQTWLKERNEDRFKMNKAHGKNYDSKNLMHVYRLLNMAEEIVEGEIKVRRSKNEIETLLKIRRGEMDYEELINGAQKKIENLDKLYDESNLPKEVDPEFISDLELKIRKKRYNLQ